LELRISKSLASYFVGKATVGLPYTVAFRKFQFVPGSPAPNVLKSRLCTSQASLRSLVYFVLVKNWSGVNGISY